MPGGVAGVEREDDVVHRPIGPWTPAVHALLEFLQGRVRYVPQVLDTSDSTETLSHLPGETFAALTDAQLASAAEWIRQFHDEVWQFEHPGPWRFFGVEQPTIIGHNDLRPDNLVFDGPDLVGVIDWDLAGPTTPAMDLAYFAWSAVPLTDSDVDLASLRLEIIAEAYGCVPEWIVDAVVPRLDVLIAGIPEAVRRGDTAMQRLVDAGEPERVAEEREQFIARHVDS